MMGFSLSLSRSIRILKEGVFGVLYQRVHEVGEGFEIKKMNVFGEAEVDIASW